MKYLKHWKYQCLWAAPFIPWIMIHYVDWMFNAGLSFGWAELSASFMTAIFTILAVVIFIIGYAMVHEND